MIYANDKKLKEFHREFTHCAWCFQFSMGPLDSHHAVIGRGAGGGTRLDVRINLLPMDRFCHDMATQGILDQGRMLSLIAEREKCRPLDIRLVLDWLLRLDKDSSPERIEEAIEELGAKSCAAALAKRVLREIGR